MYRTTRVALPVAFVHIAKAAHYGMYVYEGALGSLVFLYAFSSQRLLHFAGFTEDAS